MAKHFGDVVKALRKDLYLSINQLAEASGVSAAHISRLENELRSVPKPETIKKLASVLGNYRELLLAAGYLTGDTEKETLEALGFPTGYQPQPEEIIDIIASLPAGDPWRQEARSLLNNEMTHPGARRIIDSLARAQDLDDEDFEVIADQVERLIEYAKKKKRDSSSP